MFRDIVFVFVKCMCWTNCRYQWINQLNAPLEEIDPEISDIIELEKARQWKVSHIIYFYDLFSEHKIYTLIVRNNLICFLTSKLFILFR